ncbi:MAG: Uma2 family endonuclease, partial [Dehalococcoidia bacterium]
MAMQTTARPPASCPTLESGDRLTREEFHRRYLQRPDIKKAELINGVVYVASPVRLPQHGEPHGLLMGEFAAYRRRRKGVRIGDNSTVRFPDGSDVQPDCLLAFRGGTSIVDDEGYVIGVPELCAEIAASSVSYDLHDKKDLYGRMGVREYIVWRVED